MMTTTVTTTEGRQLFSSARTVSQIAAAISTRIVGRSPQVVRMGAAIAEVTPQNSPVLLVGAPGSGKRYLARMMHEFGTLSTRPFVVLSGADSGLDADKLRRIVQEAVNATLFVDAIECLSLEMQDLLFQCAFVEKSAAPARILACSERTLDSDVAAGHFRSELFDPFVTNVICVPSLHDRSDDVPELIQHFFDVGATRALRTDLRGLSPEARSTLESHVFFDNVRGLEHAIEHAVAFAQGPYVTIADLPQEMRKPEPVDMSLLVRSLPANGVDLKNAVETFETRMILQALERTGWNKNRAAQLLGLNRTTLVEMIKRKHLMPPVGLRRTTFRDGPQVQHEMAAE
jgi:DNA-binding NtrC family response regulator